MRNSKAAKVSVKGHITVEGIRTTFSADGTTVTEQRAVIKYNKGILSKRFMVPIALFSLDQITEAMFEQTNKFFPLNTEITFSHVRPVSGKFRVYEASLESIVRPLPDSVISSLVSSQTLVKLP